MYIRIFELFITKISEGNRDHPKSYSIAWTEVCASLAIQLMNIVSVINLSLNYFQCQVVVFHLAYNF